MSADTAADISTLAKSLRQTEPFRAQLQEPYRLEMKPMLKQTAHQPAESTHLFIPAAAFGVHGSSY